MVLIKENSYDTNKSIFTYWIYFFWFTTPNLQSYPLYRTWNMCHNYVMKSWPIKVKGKTPIHFSSGTILLIITLTIHIGMIFTLTFPLAPYFFFCNGALKGLNIQNLQGVVFHVWNKVNLPSFMKKVIIKGVIWCVSIGIKTYFGWTTVLLLVKMKNTQPVGIYIQYINVSSIYD